MRQRTVTVAPCALCSPLSTTHFITQTENASSRRWPWESALTGFGEFQWNDDDEIHISGACRLRSVTSVANVSLRCLSSLLVSGDVANAFRLYYRMTKNETWLRSEGWPVIRDSADFFASRAVACDNSSCTLGGRVGATSANLTYLNVVSPDESAGRHNSSAYTNGIAITVLDFALEAARLLGETPSANWSSISERLYLPVVDVADGFMAGTPIHTEFYGYDQKTRPHINQVPTIYLSIRACFCFVIRLSARLGDELINVDGPMCRPM